MANSKADPAVQKIKEELVADANLAGHAQTSNLAGYRYTFDTTFVDALSKVRKQHPQFFERAATDHEFRGELVKDLRASVYNAQRTG